MAEAAFEAWVDLERGGDEPSLDDWLASKPKELRHELRRMIGDYRSLRRRMGDATLALQAGRDLADFRLLREIGRGGMAVVWEAEQRSLRRRVALKILSPHYALSPHAVERFEREARAGGRLAHPGIVQTYSVGRADGIHFIAQELVPGGYTLADSLADLRELRELPDGYYRGVADLFVKLAVALEHAHRAGVLHRDVKPSNILIANDDEPRVADFGLARIQDELALSRTGDMEGTPYYMSPEQVAAKRMGIDHRTDVFSLGASLYEALTLTRAFEGDTTQLVFHKILTVDPTDPRTLRSRVPRDLAVICLKALEKNPERRFDSMGALAADLRRWQENRPIHARSPGLVVRCRRWARRHPVRSMGIGVSVAVALLVGAMYLTVRAERDAALRARTAEAAARRDAEQDRALLADALGRSEGHRLLLESARHVTSHPSLALGLAVEGSELSPGLLANNTVLAAVLESSESAMHSPDLPHGVRCEGVVAIDPISWHAAFPGSRSTIEIRHLLSWDLVAVLDTQLGDDPANPGEPPAPPILLQFGSAGRNLFAASSYGVEVWDVVTRTRTAEIEGHWPGGAAVVLSPDGSTFATHAHDWWEVEEESVQLWDASTGEAIGPLARNIGEACSAAFSPDSASLAAVNGAQVRLWDARTGEERTRVSVAWYARLAQSVGAARHRNTFVGFAPDGAIVTAGGGVRFWDPSTGRRMHEIPGQGMRVRFDPAGRRMVVLRTSGHVRVAHLGLESERADIWEYPGMQVVGALEHDQRIVDARFGPAGESIVTVSEDSTACLWSADGDLVRRLRGHRSGVVFGRFLSPESLATFSSDETLRVWTRRTWSERSTFGALGDISCARIGPDSKHLLLGSRDGSIRLANMMTGRDVFGARPVPDAPLDVLFASSGRELVTIGASAVFSWSMAGELLGAVPTITREPLGVLSDLLSGERIGATIVDPSGERVLLVSKGTGILFGLDSRALLGRFRTDDTPITAAAFSPDGAHLAVGSEDGGLTVWDTRTQDVIASTNAHADEVSWIAWVQGGEQMVTCSTEPAVRLWDIDEATGLQPAADSLDELFFGGAVDDGGSAVVGLRSVRLANGITFSAGGSTALLYRLPDTVPSRLEGHRDTVFCAGFDPTGERVVTASADGTARVWDVASGREQLTLSGHSGPVRSASFSPDGRWIVTVSEDGTARLWPADPIATARDMAVQFLSEDEKAEFGLVRLRESGEPGGGLGNRELRE